LKDRVGRTKMRQKLYYFTITLILVALIALSGCTKPGTAPIPSSSSSSTDNTAVITPAPTGMSLPTITPPSALIESRTTLNNSEYVVFAWNDLGMHCANPTYDQAVLLPPYNTVWAQVIKRGSPPTIVTSGLTVEYKVINNTYSYGKQSYSQFWDNAKKLFGVNLAKDTGLNLVNQDLHNSLSGKLVAVNDHFQVNGIPLTPINDDGSWNPYQVGQITVKDSSGKIVAQTDVTIPVSDEINCSKCHGSNPFQNILEKHDKNNGTNLVSQAPVLCASCHGDPALGVMDAGPLHYVSDHIHGFHAGVSPQPACYDCHPGKMTQCSRSLAHTAPDGNCIECHGDLQKVSSSIGEGRVPWVNEPKCVACHSGVAEVDTQNVLYRNATGHGGVYCAGCHSSPHAMIPSKLASDNYQALQYQGADKTIGSCGACHLTSRGSGGDTGDFLEKHGGSNPQIPNACYVCHTSVSSNTSLWPHSFQWHSTPGTGNVRDD
jgi:hypothetical protein